MSGKRALTIAVAVGLLCGGARAQGNWTVLFPELAQKPAPEWCKPGVRLLYTVASANIRLNPNDSGAGGGAGYTTVDVVGLDQQHAALTITSYSDGTGGRNYVSLASQGDITPPATGGDYWIHPDVLRGATRMAGQGLQILEMPYEAGGRRYDAVRFQYDAHNSQSVYVYDKATGIMVFSSNRVGPAEGDRTQGHLEFQGMRTVTWPWSNAAPPDWLARFGGMRGQGTQTIAIPGSPAMPIPLQCGFTAKQRGADWLQYELSVTMAGLAGMPPQTNTVAGVCGNGSFNGLWIPPQAIGALQAGQVLDEDPVLGIQRLVLQADANLVVLREQGRTYYLDGLYDTRTGLLRRAVKVEQSIATTTTDISFE